MGVPAEPPTFATSFTWAPPRKFQHRYAIHIVLFLLTLYTTTAAGVFADTFSFTWAGIQRVPEFWSAVLIGLTYAVPVLLILGAHEFGHYIACRIHNVDATLPYFIPLPLPPTGTLGAVIRIREAFPSKRALFDIGIAGPIAGFVVLIPFLIWGILHATVAPIPHGSDTLIFGDPLLLKLIRWIVIGPLPPGTDISIPPAGFAAWFGMLATALNLLPFGQLDGGHVVYAIAGRRAGTISIVTLGATLALTLFSLSWIFTAALLLLMALVIGFRHPRVVDEDAPLDTGRKLLALFALVMFVLCFTPVPIQQFLR